VTRKLSIVFVRFRAASPASAIKCHIYYPVKDEIIFQIFVPTPNQESWKALSQQEEGAQECTGYQNNEIGRMG
jgi:hypothetical protein